MPIPDGAGQRRKECTVDGLSGLAAATASAAVQPDSSIYDQLLALTCDQVESERVFAERGLAILCHGWQAAWGMLMQRTEQSFATYVTHNVSDAIPVMFAPTTTPPPSCMCSDADAVAGELKDWLKCEAAYWVFSANQGWAVVLGKPERAGHNAARSVLPVLYGQLCLWAEMGRRYRHESELKRVLGVLGLPEAATDPGAVEADNRLAWIHQGIQVLQEERNRYRQAQAQAESALQATEQRHRDMLLISDWVWEIDAAARFRESSERVFYLLGYTREAVLERHLFDLVTLKSKAEQRRMIQGLIERNKPFVDLELHCATRRGTNIWLACNAVPIFNADQSLQGYRGVSKDITSHKRAEIGLRISEQNQRLLLDNILTQVWYFIDDTTYGVVNKAHAKFLGVDADDLCFQSMNLFLPENVVQLCQSGNQAVFQTGEASLTDEWIPDATGDWRLLSVYRSPKFDDRGDVEYVVCSAEDITERKKAQDMLRQTQERLELAMDAGEHGLWDWDLDRDTVYISPHYYRMLGYIPDEFPATRDAFKQLMHPDDQTNVLPSIWAAVVAAEPFAAEFRLRSKDGLWKWISGRGKCFRVDAEGVPHRVVGVHVDVDERRRQDDRVRQLANIVEQAAEGIAVADLQGRLVYVNAAWASMHGYECGDSLVGQHLRTFYPKEAFERDFKRFLDSLKVQGQHRVELEHRCRDGTLLPVYEVATMLTNSAGQAHAIAMFATDIRERREADLRQRLAKTVFDSVDRGLMITDRNASLIAVNWAFSELTGFSETEIKGKNPRFRRSGQHDDAFYRDMWQRLHDVGYWQGEIWNLRRDGQAYLEDVSIMSVRDEAGVTTYYVAVVSDLTEVKRRNLELEEARRQAEAATRAKSAFLANISHEIRTPMNAVLGTAYLLQQTSLDIQQAQHVERIMGAGNILLGIINDVLDLSKIEAGKMALDQRPFNLLQIIDKTVQLVAVMAHNKGLEIVTRVAAETPVTVVGDHLRLEQVISNLLTNAIKFTDVGAVILRVDVVAFDAAAVRLAVTVEDTGIGLSQAEQTRLFSAFSQADMSTTRRHGGTGLGLSICKQLVEMMDGQITVASEVDVGSRFRFTGRFGVMDRGQRLLDTVPSALRGSRVLFFSGCQQTRTELGEQLTTLRFLLDTAATWQACVERLTVTEDYAFVLLDWQSHVAGEIEGLLQAVRARVPRAVVVLMVGHHDVAELERARTAQPQRRQVVLKPVTITRILHAMTHLFEDIPATMMVNEQDQRGRTSDYLLGRNVLLIESEKNSQSEIAAALHQAGATVLVAEDGDMAMLLVQRHLFDVALVSLDVAAQHASHVGNAIQMLAAETDWRYLKALPLIGLTRQTEVEPASGQAFVDVLAKPIVPDQLIRVVLNCLRSGRSDTEAGSRALAGQGVDEAVDEHLRELLVELRTQTVNRRAKAVRALMEKIDALPWPSAVEDDLRLLRRLVVSYRLKTVIPLTSLVIDKLKGAQ